MPHTSRGMSHGSLGESEGCQESCRAGRVPALGTVSHQGYHWVLSAPRTRQMPSPTLLSTPGWVPGPAAALAQPRGEAAPSQRLGSSDTASMRCPFGARGNSPATPHSEHSQPATSRMLLALPFLLTLDSKQAAW